MKRLLLPLLAALALPTAVLGMQHIWDFEKDKPFWGINRENAKCPGPHFKSIFINRMSSSIHRVCVDKDSIVRLKNGGRARFVDVSFAKKNTKIRGGPGYTAYRSKWQQVDCDKGTWDSSTGYSVSNKGSDHWVPIAGKSGWFEYRYNGIRRTTIESLTPKRPITYVSEESKFFCKNI